MASMMPSKSALYRSCTIFWSSTSALEFEAARNHAGGNGIGVPVKLPAEAAAASAKLADAPAPLVEVMIWWPVPDEPADGVVADSVMWKLRNRVLAASLAMTPSMRFGIQRSGNGEPDSGTQYSVLNSPARSFSRESPDRSALRVQRPLPTT
jgi:hypothetical protein